MGLGIGFRVYRVYRVYRVLGLELRGFGFGLPQLTARSVREIQGTEQTGC